MFSTDIARFLQYFRNLSNSFINILAILQDFNGIFSKHFLNLTVLCRLYCIYWYCYVPAFIYYVRVHGWSSQLMVKCLLLRHGLIKPRIEAPRLNTFCLSVIIEEGTLAKPSMYVEWPICPPTDRIEKISTWHSRIQ